MNSLPDMLWIETRKALRSGMPLWTALASLFMPLGIAFLIFAARNPDITRNLGMVSAKANLTSYAGTDWAAYLGVQGMMISAGGFFLYTLAVSWIFGREFVDGTVKDLLAVPVQRSSILLAKFLVASLWSIMLTVLILFLGMIAGVLIGLPGGSAQVIWQGLLTNLITALLILLTVLPFAFLAGVGRGYLLPIGGAIFILMLTNFVMVAGWGDVFPWAIPGLYTQGKTPLTPLSLGLVLLTCLAGMAATYLWWKNADQSK